MSARIAIAAAPVTKATPLPSAAKSRVTTAQTSDWSPGVRTIRTCQHCHTIYDHAGRAQQCEHYHEGL